jgi:hypothetical protein
VEVSGTTGGAAAEASETKPSNAGHGKRTADAAALSTGSNERASATEIEISGFCTAIRTGQPIACGAERAFDSARSCIAAHEAIQKQIRITI